MTETWDVDFLFFPLWIDFDARELFKEVGEVFKSGKKTFLKPSALSLLYKENKSTSSSTLSRRIFLQAAISLFRL